MTEIKLPLNQILAGDAVEIMNPKIVIHRLTGEGPRELTVAPDWCLNKLKVLNAIRKELERRKSCQGVRFKGLL